MAIVSPYQLPFLLGNRYLLTSVLAETVDTVLYAATQVDMSREVVVESLRSEAAEDSLRTQSFLDAAHAQARMGGGSIAVSLELLYEADTWHLARERVEGEALDEMLVCGRKLPAAAVCELLQLLCQICLHMDIEGIAGEKFMMQHLYYMNPGFRLRNPARGGERSRSTSRDVLMTAATEIMPLVDDSTHGAAELFTIMNRMRYPSDWSPLSPLYYDEELVRLQQAFSCCKAEH